MWGHDEGVAPGELAAKVSLEADQVEAAYREIERKRVATEYLHAPAVLVDPTD
jgi:NAD+ synthase